MTLLDIHLFPWKALRRGRYSSSPRGQLAKCDICWGQGTHSPRMEGKHEGFDALRFPESYPCSSSWGSGTVGSIRRWALDTDIGVVGGDGHWPQCRWWGALKCLCGQQKDGTPPMREAEDRNHDIVKSCLSKRSRETPLEESRGAR